jgi:ABC-type lipopolysaccharide export system ATPase subunit
MQVCQRAYVLVKGSVVLQGLTQDLGNREALIDSYLGQQSLADVGEHGQQSPT